jgi:hypothetical protein
MPNFMKIQQTFLVAGTRSQMAGRTDTRRLHLTFPFFTSKRMPKTKNLDNITVYNVYTHTYT